jgi:arylsulfatase
MPDKPFFVYFAPGATHAPHHVPKEWADKYEGQFADGWDAFASARSPGRRSSGSSRPMPSSRRATRDPCVGRHADELKPVLAREMEVYAGFLEHADHHVGG